MPYALIFALLLTAAAALGAVRLRTKQDNAVNVPGIEVGLSDLGSISWGEVEILLDRLESEKLPKAVMGAMCYGAALYPEVAEYTCPACGEMTEYTNNQTQFIEWELQGCRRLFDSISGAAEMDLVLDETRFCSFCTPGEGETPSLYLLVTLEDGTVVSNQIGQHDLMLLDGFLGGRLYYITWNDGQEPLQPHADRIRTLLGIEGVFSEE